MAGRYSVGLEALGQAQVNLIGGDVRVLALEATYVADLVADAYYAGSGTDVKDGWLAKDDGTLVPYDDAFYASTGDIDKSVINTDADAGGVNNPRTSVVGYSSAGLSSKTVAGGKLDGSDPLFAGLPGAKTITQFAVTLFDHYVIGGASTSGSGTAGVDVYRHIPLALITKKSDDTDISFDTGGGLDLLVRWENVAPYVFEL